MHSTPGDSPREVDPDAQGTEQGTLDPFMGPQGGRRKAPVRVTLAYAGVDFPKPPGEAKMPAPPTTTQRSIDAFLSPQPPAPAECEELVARAPRAMAGLALERAIERAAVRAAAAGITRDELIIVVARECDVPLEELTLVDSYISDLVLEGKLAIAGERIVLARSEAPVARARARARAAPALGGRRADKAGTERRPSGRTGRRRASGQRRASGRRRGARGSRGARGAKRDA